MPDRLVCFFRVSLLAERGVRKLKSILHEFYYGNLNPNERPTVQSSECKQFLKIVADSEEKLLRLLDGAEKELFQTFSDAHGKMSSVAIADGFVEGFCIGMQVTIDVLQKR